jgi:type 1 glutamine amidotransferase
MLKAALASDGFNFSYTTDTAALNEANLAKYDALLIYSNHRALEPAQEKALLDFVVGGKGLLALHSASFCFQNSTAYVGLLGAQFARHGTGEFTATLVTPSHPVLTGVQPFQVWDETYVHTKLSADRTVLMERAEGTGREPWTWVRTHGKGRVFYTAYGHDERVWGHPGFHTLMKNAITWAIGPGIAARLSALAIAPLQYSDAEIAAAAPDSRSREAPADPARLRAAAVRGRAPDRRQPGSDGVGRARPALDRGNEGLSQQPAAWRPGQ